MMIRILMKNIYTPRKFCDVNLSRSGSFDTGYGGLDDATSGEGR